MTLLKVLLLTYLRGLRNMVFEFCLGVVGLVMLLVGIVTLPIWLPLYLGLGRRGEL